MSALRWIAFIVSAVVWVRVVLLVRLRGEIRKTTGRAGFARQWLGKGERLLVLERLHLQKAVSSTLASV